MTSAIRAILKPKERGISSGGYLLEPKDFPSLKVWEPHDSKALFWSFLDNHGHQHVVNGTEALTLSFTLWRETRLTIRAEKVQCGILLEMNECHCPLDGAESLEVASLSLTKCVV